MARNKHSGSSFDSFLKEEGLLEEVSAAALKRVIAWQIEQLMKEQAITKSALAERMQTSRAQVNRLLDHDNPALTLESLSGAARALGQVVRIELVPAAGKATKRRARIITLRPVRMGEADAVRRKLDALGIKEADIEYAIRWARRRK